MLRHIRMTPSTKEIPKADSRIFGLLQDWIHPFYRYRIPHTPTPRDRVCNCAYPLFTLRSSHRSPYDEPASMTAMHETVYVDSTGKSTSGPASEVVHGLNTASSSSVSPPTMHASTQSSAGASAAAAAGGETASTSSAPADSSDLSIDASATASHTSAFLSSFGALPSLKARWAVRRRRGGRLTTPPQSTETCYRCDICDGLQQSTIAAAVTTEGEVDSTTSRQVSTGAASEASASFTKSHKQEIVVEDAEDVDGEDDDEEEETAAAAEKDGEERYGYTTSTDIANTAMEDADVAELRHLDPFHVEVFGKPSWGTLLKRASREVQGQLNRCGLRSRDTSRYAAQATANSEVSRQAYRLWVRTEAQRVREAQRRSMQPAVVARGAAAAAATDVPETAGTAPNEISNAAQISTAATPAAAAAAAATASSPSSSSSAPSAPPSSSPAALSANALTLSLEQRAIIKDKLDTLHLAAYLARYAVAAYGLPYELNFFTSVRELTKLMAEPHSRYVCANSEEQLESMRRMLQGEEPDALLECVASRYSLRVGQPCWSLFLDHAAQRVILSFRGSLTASDMVIDVMEGYANVLLEHTHDAVMDSTSDPLSSSSSSVPLPQRVCTAIPLGFYDAVVEAGAQLLPILRTIHAQYAAYTLCVTGHSLGGIEASVFHLLYCGPWRATLQSSSSLLRRTKPPRSLAAAEVAEPALMESPAGESTGPNAHVPFARTITCTLAAAPVMEKRVLPVVNAWLAAEERRSGSRLITMSHGMDLVTRLQVHSLKETFTQAYTVATAAAEKPTNVAAGGNPAPTPSSSLFENLDVPSVSDKSVVPVLAVPGTMYNVTTGTRRRYLLAVPPTATAVREQIILSAEAVLQHFPCLYLRSLAELLNRYEAKWNSLKATAPDAAASAGECSTHATAAKEPELK